jgi:hypothetical protein
MILSCIDSTSADLAAFLTPDNVRGMLRGVVAKGNGLMSTSHLLWQLWIDWELSQPIDEYVSARDSNLL